MAANQVVAQQSAAVLTKLAKLCRDRAGCGGSSTSATIASSGTAGSTGRDGHNTSTSTSTSMFIQSFQHIQPVLTHAAYIAVESKLMGTHTSAAGTTSNQPSATSQHSWGSILQLPVQHSECCNLLQDGVRLMAAAAAADAPSSSLDGLDFYLRSVGTLLGGVSYEGDISLPGSSGALVAPVAAAADALSPETLQLFALLCSFLKVYSNSTRLTGAFVAKLMLMSTSMLSAHSGSSDDSPNLHDIITAGLTAVSTTLNAALNGSLSGAHSRSISGGTSSSTSSGITGSSACTAALPWLVLLGRCCRARARACAVLLQHCQRTLQSDDATDRFQPHQ
jgi:hypothetical protein